MRSFARFAACAAFLLFTSACASRPVHLDTTPTEAPRQHTSPWLLHDPGFAVDVHLSPFGDESWTDEHIRAQDAQRVLQLPSSLLNLTVVLPRMRNLTDVRVVISIFKPLGTHSSSSSSEYELLADTQVQHAQSYRVDVRHAADEVVVRAYIEGSVGRMPDGADAKARAFFVRSVALAPSEAYYVLCDSETPTDMQDATAHVYVVPPANMPSSLCRQFTMNGRVPLRKWYFDDQTNAEQSYAPRSAAYIDALVVRARAREQFYYGATDTHLYAALDAFPIAHQHVLIIGSTTPWYESICLARGAASCTMIDYNRVQYDHPALRTFTLAEFAAAVARGAAPQHFDAILSISSFEHDGLGRYGDPLAPDADLAAMESTLQYAHATTRLFLAVPVGPDCVVWNAQRIYGPLRLPLLVQPWRVVESFGFQKSDFTAPFTLGHQPIFVLEPHARNDAWTEL